jgi:nucleoside-diphosphate-sugar epimerase
MKVTILGSSGQIGAYLTEYLRDRNHEVTEFDIVRNFEEDLAQIPNHGLEKAIKDSDFVFFLAFTVGGSRYLKKFQNTFEFVNSNTRLMTNVFTILEQYKTPFVFASSQMSNMSYSPYGLLKRVGEIYTEILKGLTVKFWNVYGVENDREKSHVITDLIRRGFEEGEFEMLSDGTEERQFLYAEDCCEALYTVMECFNNFKPTDPLHITSFRSTTIKEVASIIQGQFNRIGMHDVKINPGIGKDSVQMDKRNEADLFITKWWMPNTTIEQGIAKVFDEMKKEYMND